MYSRLVELAHYFDVFLQNFWFILTSWRLVEYYAPQKFGALRPPLCPRRLRLCRRSRSIFRPQNRAFSCPEVYAGAGGPSIGSEFFWILTFLWNFLPWFIILTDRMTGRIDTCICLQMPGAAITACRPQPPVFEILMHQDFLGTFLAELLKAWLIY